MTNPMEFCPDTRCPVCYADEETLQKCPKCGYDSVCAKHGCTDPQCNPAIAKTAQDGKIATVDTDEAFYLGIEGEGVYFDADEGINGWYMSTVVDTNRGAYCGDMTTDDGPYESRGRALEAGLNAAYEWLATNDILRGWRTDEKKLRRQFQRMAKKGAAR